MQQIMRLSSCICMHLPSWSISCICMHLPSWSVSCIRCQHRLSVRTVCIKILHFTFGFHIFDRCLMYFSAEMYSAWMRRAAGSRSPSLLLTTTKSDTSTMPRLIPARTTCTDNSHPVLKATLTHVLIHSAPLDPCTDNSCPVLKETLTHILIQQFSLPLVDHLYTALFSDLEQTHCALDMCHLKAWLAFYCTFWIVV